MTEAERYALVDELDFKFSLKEISPIEYLEQMPDGFIPEKDVLLRELSRTYRLEIDDEKTSFGPSSDSLPHLSERLSLREGEHDRQQERVEGSG